MSQEKNFDSLNNPNELICSNSNYRKYDSYISRYRYARIPLNNITGSVVPLGLNATTLMEWKLPAKTVFNLAESFVSYNYTIPLLASNYAAAFEASQDLCQWLYFGDGGGLGITDLNYVDRYTNIITPYRTSNTEALGKDQLNTGSLANVNYNRNMVTPTGLTTQNVYPTSFDGIVGNGANSAANSYLEPTYLRFGAIGAALVVNRLLPLSVFKDTFVGVNKNSIFGRDMYLRFNTQYGSRLGFYTTTPNAPDAAFTAITDVNMNYSGVYLYLAIEENKVLVDSLMSALLQGSIRYAIPYSYTYRYGASGTSSNLSITLTRQFGHKLKRLTYACFNGKETSIYTYDHSNVNGTKISQIQSSIDSRPLTDYQLNCFNPNNGISPTNVNWTYPANGVGGSIAADDYREMRNKFQVGSTIPSYLSYQLNWCYMDAWGLQDMMKNYVQNVPDENIDDGLKLGPNSRPEKGYLLVH